MSRDVGGVDEISFFSNLCGAAIVRNDVVPLSPSGGYRSRQLFTAGRTSSRRPVASSTSIFHMVARRRFTNTPPPSTRLAATATRPIGFQKIRTHYPVQHVFQVFSSFRVNARAFLCRPFYVIVFNRTRCSCRYFARFPRATEYARIYDRARSCFHFFLHSSDRSPF